MKKHKKNKLIPLLFMLFVLFAFLWLITQQENNEAQEIDLELLVLPSNDGNLTVHNGYTLCYSEEHEQPIWVAYVLTPEELQMPSVTRKDSFKADPAIKTGSAQLADYKSSGYDRGHMAPFADLSWSEESASDSFYLSNMSPQNSSLNRGKWADLESTVRKFAKKEPMCIVTGPVLTDGPFETIGENQVSVPHYYYKVILDYVGDEIKAIGFLLPNEKCDGNLYSYAVTVDEIETLTGLDFFPMLEDDIESSLESCFDYSAWF